MNIKEDDKKHGRDNSGDTAMYALRYISHGDFMDRTDNKLLCHVLFVMTEGIGVLYADGQSMNVRSGSCLLLKPGAKLMIRSEYGCPLQGYEIGFDGFRYGADERDGEPPLRRKAEFPLAGSADVRRHPEITALADQLHAVRTAGEDRAVFNRHRLFLTLLERVWAVLEQESRSDGRQAIEAVLSYMERNYGEELTRDRLAERAGMSPGYFSSLFRKETGQSPMEALTAIRVNRAKEYLLASGLRLKDIARRVGFSSEYYFSSRFKQITGLSPSSYVKRSGERQLLSSDEFTAHVRAAQPVRQRLARNEQPRIIGLFMEDDLTALGVKPIVQYANDRYYQQYLASHLDGVQMLDVNRLDWTKIRSSEPDLIMLAFPNFAYGGQYELFASVAPTYVFREAIRDWRKTLLTAGELIGREKRAVEAIGRYEAKSAAARTLLRSEIGSETVALVRLHQKFGLSLYGGRHGYACPILYGDLELVPPKLLREWRWGADESVRAVRPDVLRELDADHLFLLIDEGMDKQAQQLLHSEIWNGLRAVRAGRVYRLRPDIWLTFGIMAHERKIDNVLEALT